MSETVLQESLNTQKKMTRKATSIVLFTALAIHIIVNVFAYVNHDPFLKIEAPILSGITLLAILIGVRVFKHS